MAVRPEPPVAAGQADEVHVTLPCTPDHFAEFIAGLLGKPQTISRIFYMVFEIEQNDLESLHHLIVQRITQQNEATLTQFVAVVSYDDASTVRINSFDDFIHYSEVRPLRSLAVNLTWIFLIRFQDRSHPEKQEINIRFATPEHYRIERRSFEAEMFHPRPRRPGVIEVHVNYTARTWGNDVDGLIKGHIESLERPENPALGYFYRKRGWICFLIFAVMLGVGIYATLRYAARLDEITRVQIDALLANDRPIESVLLDALRAFIRREFILGESIPSLGLFLVGIPVSLIGAVILTVFSDYTLNNLARESQIILTRQSRSRAEENRVAYKRNIASFVAAQLLNILICALVATLGSILPTQWLL